MRVLLILAVMLLPTSTTRADGIFELAGALTFPAADNNWVNTVEPSPELAVRAGGGNDELAGLASLAWTPERLDAQPIAGLTDASGHRFRILGNVEVRRRLLPKLTLGGRIGAGVDIVHGSYSFNILGTTTSKSDTDVGFGIDLAAGVWFDVGATTQLGVELGVPIGYHSKKAAAIGDLSFDYTQVDIELWVELRFGSRSD
jgi:hypothetical protein